MDPSSSIDAQAYTNSIQPEVTRAISGMDPDLYYAAAKGKFGVFENIQEPLDLLRTPNENTILHIYLTTLVRGSGNSTTSFVEKVLDKCPLLFRQTNAQGETLLHIAARYGHSDIVEFLLERARVLDQDHESGIKSVREILRITNKEKDTALHEAVRYNWLEVVRKLVKEDPDFSYFGNDSGETPLYMAVERNFKDLAYEILDTCKSPAYSGPLGRTALHAAIPRSNIEMDEKLFEKLGAQIVTADHDQGWTPLHLAAYFNSPHSARFMLSKVDRKVAYMKDTKSRTALHIAANRGSRETMEVIISSCPDCCEVVDNRGHNALHSAMDGYWAKKIVEIILKNSSLSNLLNEKDTDGNTPLHHQSTSEYITEDLLDHPRVDKMAFNKKNLNACDMAFLTRTNEQRKWEYIEAALMKRSIVCRPPQRVITDKYEIERVKNEEKYKETEMQTYQAASGSHLVAATLIATVTFAAGITMPGGFVDGDGPHPGSAVLTKSPAFKAFIINDTISLVLSSCSVLIHLLMPLLIKYEAREKFFNAAWLLILVAMVAMVLTFVTGTYAVLAHSLDLAIPSLIIGLSFFAILFLIFQKKAKYAYYY